jgi:colicin import membrane protein
MENTEIVKINPTEFGLTEETASNITKGLSQILAERVILSEQYAEIITLDIDDPKTAKRASELRKLIKDNRTKGIVKWHETNKEFYLRGGQFVDAIKKRELEVNNRMEEALEQIEKRQEILERERIAKVQSLRVNLISGYVENAERMDLGNMQDDVWEAFYAAKKKEHEDKIEAAKLAEAQRLIDEENERIENERIRVENERLKAEAEEREKQIAAERLAKEEELRIEKEKAAKEKAEREEIIRKEQEAINAETVRLAAIEREKFNAEREAKEKLEAELEAKQKSENDAYEQKIAAEEKAKKEAEKLAKAPIKKKLQVWVDSFEINRTYIEEGNETAKLISDKFDAFKAWAKTQVENI